jgi:hypothetical protein
MYLYLVINSYFQLVKMKIIEVRKDANMHYEIVLIFVLYICI